MRPRNFMKRYLTICKIIKYLLATWAKALIVTCSRIPSFGLQIILKEYSGDFPGGAVVENPPANAGDTGLSLGPGRSHMPRSN